MIRDPRGPRHINKPTTRWNPSDKQLWKPQYISQVPGGIDPTNQTYFDKSGVFFLDHADFSRCFSGIAQARDKSKEGYKNSWYDVDHDNIWQLMFKTDLSREKSLYFQIPAVDGVIYISVESYFIDMIPESCYSDRSKPFPTVDIKIY